MDGEKLKRLHEPFPNGESYDMTTVRMKSFLEDLSKGYDGKRVMIIGHRTTWYGLEHLINGVGMEELVTRKFKWQGGGGGMRLGIKNTVQGIIIFNSSI